jgi:hypothetical protein
MSEESGRPNGLPASNDAETGDQDADEPVFVDSSTNNPFRSIGYFASGVAFGDLLRPEARVFLGDLAVERPTPLKAAPSWDAGDVLQKIRTVYVPPPAYPAAQDLLRRERLVVLSGYRRAPAFCECVWLVRYCGMA